MPQISKRPLDKKVKEKIFNTLFESILHIGERKMVQDFLNDLLTPTEKIMLSKRLTAAYFIDKGYSYRLIANALKLSPATVNTIQKELIRNGNGYRAVFQLALKSSKLEDLIERLDKIMVSVIPPIKISKSSYRH